MAITLPKYAAFSAALMAAVVWHALHTRRVPCRPAARLCAATLAAARPWETPPRLAGCFC